MKWIALIFGSLAFLVILITVVGALLPRGHVASRHARYAQPQDRVFNIISDFASAAGWRTDVSQIEILPDREGKTVFREYGKNGQLTFLVEEMMPPDHLVTRVIDQSAFGGTWTYSLHPVDGGCQLVVIERGEVFNPVFRFLGRFFFSQTATIDTYLVALGKKLGETVTPLPWETSL